MSEYAHIPPMRHPGGVIRNAMVMEDHNLLRASEVSFRLNNGKVYLASTLRRHADMVLSEVDKLKATKIATGFALV